MAFEVLCECYPRCNYYRKRLESIGPRFNYICNEEFESDNLRRTNEDEKTLGEINRLLKDYSEREYVHVVLIGDKPARDVVSARRLLVKTVCQSDVTFNTSSTVKLQRVYVVVIEMDPENEQDFRRDLHARLDEVPKSERKYVVLVIIPCKAADRKHLIQTVRKHTNCLETPDNNFDFDECIVILPTLEVLQRQELEANKPVLRESTRREDAERPRSPGKRKVPSPPKRKFNPEETSQHEDRLTSLETPSGSGTDIKTNASNQVCDNNEITDDSPEEYDEKAIGKAISYQLESKGIDIVEEIENYLKHLKSRRDGFAGEVQFTDLDKMMYELKGLYNISETKKGRRKKEEEIKGKLSDELAADLLKLDHVRGCGRVYGKLDVHVAADADHRQKEEAKTAIESVIRRHEYKLPYDVRYIKSKLYQMRKLIITVEL